jgi:hypothetical protein
MPPDICMWAPGLVHSTDVSTQRPTLIAYRVSVYQHRIFGSCSVAHRGLLGLQDRPAVLHGWVYAARAWTDYRTIERAALASGDSTMFIRVDTSRRSILPGLYMRRMLFAWHGAHPILPICAAGTAVHEHATCKVSQSAHQQQSWACSKVCSPLQTLMVLEHVRQRRSGKLEPAPQHAVCRRSSGSISAAIPSLTRSRGQAVMAAVAADQPSSDIAAPQLPFRIGHGFDLHRLEEG